MNWIKEINDPETREWEELYRTRWSYDKTVRTTHGVNCTGGCSWMVYVKEGIVTWEMQALDYPQFDPNLPSYEPRGCQRGISASWYCYSPIRVKYPYIRGTLLDLWRDAKDEHSDLLEAWASIVENPEKRKRYQKARGKGGFRRASWDEAVEISTISCIYTIKKHGPDRVTGFSPIPAMSMVSYAAGSRFLQLMGGVNLSFYDWYCDLPPASPEIWGDQTDVQESADWYNSKFIIAMGSNINMTRTPDTHFISEARQAGAKFVVFSPDFSQVSKYADWWIPVNAGQDGAFWMAVDHVILKEFYVDRQVPDFIAYIKQYSDCPFLIEIEEDGDGFKPGRCLRAEVLEPYAQEENADWKFLIFDSITKECKMPLGSVGHRWGKTKGKWNLELKDAVDGKEIDPVLSFIDESDDVVSIKLHDFSHDKINQRGVPVKKIQTSKGTVTVTTVFDLLMAQFGVSRGLQGDYPANYDDAEQTYTPAWQEQYTGIDKNTVIQFAREFATSAEKTGGKNTIIIGAGINHWFHNNLNYRSAIVGLMLTGSIGKNGGGLAHYVGQEKLAPMGSWSNIAMALDWARPPRLQNATSWHYIHSDQWRYDTNQNVYHTMPKDSELTNKHAADMNVQAVLSGWLPFYPQFEKNSLDLVQEAISAGKSSDEDIREYVVDQVKSRKLKFSIEDPDAESNWPRTWFIWRGNAIMSSAKGHEFFLKHYLGTHSNAIKDEQAEDIVKDIKWHKIAPEGKMDLIVDLNFRMDTSALYSDIVLPAAMWYEKDDLNSTDLHSYIHPLQAAVPPSWESKSDWDIFKTLAKKFSELSEKYFDDTIKDVVAVPLAHDTPAEIAQPTILDWRKGECEAIPGKTMPDFVVVDRDYKNLYNRFISYGPAAKKLGLGAHGASWSIDDFYDEEVQTGPTETWGGETYPSLETAVNTSNIIMKMAPECNGELGYRAYKNHEEKVGLPLTDLVESTRDVRMTFSDIVAQPRRLLTSPSWSGIMNKGRAYSPFTINIDKKVPWRTLTGRQHFYLDHQGYIEFGEHLPTYKPKPDHQQYGDLGNDPRRDQTLLLNYLTPHGKWHIHSTFSENNRMLTLGRGIEPCWLNVQDAESVGIHDNDWVEVTNDNGVMVTRAVVSARIPPGIAIIYHSPERTYSVPKSPARNNKRAGGHNSLTRVRLKQLLMVGGYGQFTYHFNYWGPTGVNRDTFIHVRRLDQKPEW
ncbi:MAG: Respiratory nitrate reductase 1 alpha chain [Chlamydiae bacterium]|nr:Respiratory nitrate reductase 1 alpha chain [Chlamydiota bacterium]